MDPSLPPPSKRQRGNQNEVIEFSSERKLSPVVVFAHGAGAPSTSEWMIRWKEMLQKTLEAVNVITFDYPYISGGKRKAPPRAEKLVNYHLDIVKRAIQTYPGHPLILAGKSMGSRVSCMVSILEDVHVSALVCLGYPLKGMNGSTREDTLLQLKVPTIFIQGSKDSLCPLDKLEMVRKKMSLENELHVIEGGDHSFKIGKKFLQLNRSSQDEAEKQAVSKIAEFVGKCIRNS